MTWTDFLSQYQLGFQMRVGPSLVNCLEGLERFERPYQNTFDLIMRGGKRLRSGLVAYLSQEGVDSTLEEALVELFHAALLIHDDLVDHADLRRGGPAFHLAIGDADQSLIWGDMLFARIGKVFADHLNQGALFQTVFDKTCLGQLLDLKMRSAHQQSLCENDFQRAYGLKTGYYTFYLPLVLAYDTHDSLDHKGIELLPTISERLGLMFQVADDLLLFHPRASECEKSVRSDFDLKQLTFPLWWLQCKSGVPAFEESQTFEVWLKRLQHEFVVYEGKHWFEAWIRETKWPELPDDPYFQKLNQVIEFTKKYFEKRIQSCF